MTARWIAVDPNGGLWRRRALCRPELGHDPEMWFPRPASVSGVTRQEVRAARLRDQKREAAAKAICECCPVALECLQHAQANNEREGIWGGQTPHERGVSPLR